MGRNDEALKREAVDDDNEAGYDEKVLAPRDMAVLFPLNIQSCEGAFEVVGMGEVKCEAGVNGQVGRGCGGGAAG